jgi:ABC-type nickel/cobalt efflux system permease component RcnA
LGLAANALLPDSLASATQAQLEHPHGGASWLWLYALGALLLWSLLRQGVRPFLERLFESPANLDGQGDHSSCAHGDSGHDHGHDQGHSHAHPHSTPDSDRHGGSCCHHHD